MSIDVDSDAWTDIDSWWSSFADTELPVISKGETSALHGQRIATFPVAVDPWWDVYVQTHSQPQVAYHDAVLDSRVYDGAWEELGPWWDSFSDARQADVQTLRTQLEEQNREWKRSASRFDIDPLSTDWTRHADTRGPLRPNQEENWSQWLAHILRSAPDRCLQELFGERFPTTPTTVQREVHLSNPDTDGADRYPDILLFSGSTGLSIEVKKGDEHYRKTTDTTHLIEHHYHHDWSHVLLLPRSKQPALESTFDDTLETEEHDRPRIPSNQSDPIDTVYWDDISRALRTVLRDGDAPDPHWAASAYLLCTLIEQKILQFIPSPTIDRLADAPDILYASQSVTTSGVDDQIEYFRTTSEAHNE